VACALLRYRSARLNVLGVKRKGLKYNLKNEEFKISDKALLVALLSICFTVQRIAEDVEIAASKTELISTRDALLYSRPTGKPWPAAAAEFPERQCPFYMQGILCALWSSLELQGSRDDFSLFLYVRKRKKEINKGIVVHLWLRKGFTWNLAVACISSGILPMDAGFVSVTEELLLFPELAQY